MRRILGEFRTVGCNPILRIWYATEGSARTSGGGAARVIGWGVLGLLEAVWRAVMVQKRPPRRGGVGVGCLG